MTRRKWSTKARKFLQSLVFGQRVVLTVGKLDGPVRFGTHKVGTAVGRKQAGIALYKLELTQHYQHRQPAFSV